MLSVLYNCRSRALMARLRVYDCRGQAMLEYAIVAGVMVAMMAVLSLFLSTFGEYGERILDMIASDYP